jgi:threonylcarbamoyladenosine tRNA methylthiotransferase MtaB
MPALPREVVKARAARLRETAADRRAHWLDGLIGTQQRMLVENGGKGHADNFAPVAVPGADKGEVLAVRITGRDGDHLMGIAE